MEFYIPETEFERADFKGVKDPESAKKAGQKPSGKEPQNAASKPVPGQVIQGRKAPPDTRTTNSPAIPPELPAQAREPEARSYKIRDRFGNPVSDSAPARSQKGPAGRSRPRTAKTIQGRALPQARSPREARKQALQKAHDPGSWQPQQLTKADLKKTPKASPQAAGNPAQGVGNPAALLQQTVLANLEGTRHVLRNWYWEKAGQGDPLLSFAAPHDRIQLILKACGMQILPTLFQTMTPKEREQMVAILKRPASLPTNWLPAIQTAFMRALEEQSQW